jgi:type IV secretory pathway TraG/TraD family ATPase VirD4
MRADMVVKNGVDFRALKRRCTTTYAIIPASEMLNKAAYLRLLLSTASRHLYQHDGLPVTVLVDEAFVLGHLTELENACSILRGYGGSRLVTAWQSVQQTKKLYADTAELFGLGASICFRPGDISTAEWMVRKAGKVSGPVLSASDPSNPNDMQTRPSWSAKERDRIPLHKMFEMPQGAALVSLPHKPVQVARVRGYFEIPELNRRADANPYYRGGASMPRRRRA